MSNNYSWLDNDDVPLEPFYDFFKLSDDSRDINYEVSVWLIEDSYCNIERILAALVANQQSVSIIDYILIDKTKIDDLLFELELDEGNTKDKTANEKWHYNLTKISGLKLSKLINVVFKIDEDNRVHRKTKTQAYKLLAESIFKGNIEFEDLSFTEKHKTKIREEVSKLSDN